LDNGHTVGCELIALTLYWCSYCRFGLHADHNIMRTTAMPHLRYL